MPETQDPHVALEDADVAVRAAAARDLAESGTLDDLGLLLAKATGDRSPSVRLYAAAAAASVLRRVRADGPLSKAVSEQVLDALRRFDPQVNPSVLLALGAVGPSVRGRLGRLLKDPHSDVRQAALAALRAEALSPLALADRDLPEQIAGWVRSSLPGEVRLDLGRLIGEVGHPDGEALLTEISTSVRDPDDVLSEARRRLRARRTREAWVGVWRRQEPEVLVPPDPKLEVPWLGLGDDAWITESDEGSVMWVEERGSVWPVGPEGPARLLWIGIPGQEEVHLALQTAKATRFGCRGKDLAAWVEVSAGALRRAESLARVLLDQLDGVEGNAVPRARALLLWRSGDVSGAAAALDELLDTKKPTVDLHWWRANVALSEGDLDAAREQVDLYLEKAPKRAAFLDDAEGLRASLGT
jgi:hypothetical protein